MTLRDTFFYAGGIASLALARLRYTFKGYHSPKPFELSETQRCIDYDIGVVDRWLECLRDYTNCENALSGKDVLELGPGSDLGTGICLLARGAAKYYACDVNDLMRDTPDSFYQSLFARLQSNDSRTDVRLLQSQLKLARAWRPSRLNYVVRNDFDIVAALGRNSIDLVFSQAAFEHFDDLDRSVAQLSRVCRPGSVLIAQIDLKTHSRWIRDRDPNNIYRFSKSLYDLFGFRGIPNRVRPYQYKRLFERFAWTDVSIIPVARLDSAPADTSGLDRLFHEDINQMDYLSIMLCARKAGASGR